MFYDEKTALALINTPLQRGVRGLSVVGNRFSGSFQREPAWAINPFIY